MQVRRTLSTANGKGFTFGEPKTARSRRSVKLPALALAALKRHRRAQLEERMRLAALWEDHDLVFANRRGNPVSRQDLTTRSFKPLLRRAGLPDVRFHDLRHTCATILLRAGKHPKYVQELLERFADRLRACDAWGMNAYSKDLRLKVLQAVQRGVPRKEVAGLLGISISTISRYVKLKASGEGIAPKPSPGRTSKILGEPAHRRSLWRQLERNDTATLEEHCEMFEEERGVRVSVATMSRAVRKLGWTFKKGRWHPPNATSKGEDPSEGT